MKLAKENKSYQSQCVKAKRASTEPEPRVLHLKERETSAGRRLWGRQGAIEFGEWGHGAVATRACCSKHVSNAQQLHQNLPEHDAFQLLPPAAKKISSSVKKSRSSLNIVTRAVIRPNRYPLWNTFGRLGFLNSDPLYTEPLRCFWSDQPVSAILFFFLACKLLQSLKMSALSVKGVSLITSSVHTPYIAHN